MAFKKGKSGNPNGRPPGGSAFLDQLRQAVKDVEKAKKKKLFNHFVRQAFKDNSVLIALMKKLVPDVKHIEGNINANVNLAQTASTLFNAWQKEQDGGAGT